ncbi:hypothetical protein B0H11DRAFT_1947628, partial [Mycena galericulata]
ELLDLFKHSWLTFLPPTDVIHGSDAVVFHFVKTDGLSKARKKYNEYMLTFRFAGEKIVSMKEFVDSKYSTSYFAHLN